MKMDKVAIFEREWFHERGVLYEESLPRNLWLSNECLRFGTGRDIAGRAWFRDDAFEGNAAYLITLAQFARSEHNFIHESTHQEKIRKKPVIGGDGLRRSIEGETLFDKINGVIF